MIKTQVSQPLIKPIVSLALAALMALPPISAYASTTMESCLSAKCRSYFNDFDVYASSGHKEAIATIAEMYYHGYGTKKNLRRAVKYYKKAAFKGVPSAQYKMGLIYLYNDHYQDTEKGLTNIQQAAQRQHPGAMHTLGLIYLHNQNLAQADYWLAQAYRHGDTSMPNLVEQLKRDKPATLAQLPQLNEEAAENWLVWQQADKNKQASLPEYLDTQLNIFKERRRRTVQWPRYWAATP
ncbi:tetratricopeptide repeat protein [Thalassotalea euphylliae]|nr:tetratricopeptide repeat protein [Thalassotalea euphylliae]